MATWLSGVSRYLRTIRKNAFVWCFIYLLLFSALILRLLWLQTVKQSYYSEMGEQYRFREAVLPAARGRILDCNFNVLAQDNERLSLYTDPALCVFPWEIEYDSGACARFVAKRLAPVINRPEEEVQAELQRQRAFVWIKQNLSPETTALLRHTALPGLQLKADGFCYRVGVELAKVQSSADLPVTLADALQLPTEEVRDQLGLTLPVDHESSSPARRTGKRWVRGVYQEETKRAIEGLRLPGVIFMKDRQNYSLGVDPRPFLNRTPGYNAKAVANALAPTVEMSPKAVQSRLLSRQRFAWLKRGMPEDMLHQVQRLQGTMYLIEPGRVLADYDADMTTHEAVAEATNRLYDMLNEKRRDVKTKKYVYTEVISKAEITRRLRGTEPCVLGERLVKGAPALSVTRSLLAKPIPGVVYGLPGIATQQERRRFYPYGSLAAATLGFVLIDDNQIMHGVFGLEQVEEKTLAGVDGFEAKEIDARRRTIPEQSKQTDPIDGRDIVLTLDHDIQLAAEEALALMVKETKALGGQCVVMESNSGEILALASEPSWDANDPGGSKVPLVNPVISNFYEPGSIFKVVPVMAALEEGMIRDGQRITNCSGPIRVGNRPIREAHNYHGPVDAGRLLEQSCNIGAATLALQLGSEKFLSWCERLGFGKTTGIELHNESAGTLNRTNARKARVTLANMGFGQSMAVTPLQMAAAYSAIANGGYLVQPHLIKAHLRRDGTQEEVQVTRNRVCSEETARLLRGYLERVVTKGTGKSGKIPGYSVAGKTGTAQKSGIGGYRSGKAIGSFIGFTPVEKPRLTIIAVMDEPQTSHYGGVVAAPVFKEVGSKALSYLNVPPTNPAPESIPGGN